MNTKQIVVIVDKETEVITNFELEQNTELREEKNFNVFIVKINR